MNTIFHTGNDARERHTLLGRNTGTGNTAAEAARLRTWGSLEGVAGT